MPVESHLLMDGALHVYRREGSRFWQCATYLGSRNHRQTTKEVSLAAAKDFARDWYMERCVEDRQRRRGGVSLLNGPVAQPVVADPGPPAESRRQRSSRGPSFEDAATAFTNEFEVITLGERNAGYVKSKSDIVRVHLYHSLAKRRLKTSRPARSRSIGFIARHRGSTRRPASRRNPPARPCMARSSRSGRY